MPTTLPRHTITETPDIARVLDAAARCHPGLSRQQVLRAVLLEAGATEAEHIASERHRLAQVLDRAEPALAIGGDAVAEIAAMREQDRA